MTERGITYRVDIAGRIIDLSAPASSEDLLNALAGRDPSDPDVCDERLPYWADLWPSAVALATHLLRDRALRAGEQVVELGCGLGLAGIAAGLAGAEVLLTDYAGDALEYAARNWRVNVGTPPRTRWLDWRDPPADVRADVLLAADEAYERRVFAPLARTVLALLRPGGRVLLTEPQRALAEGFFPLLAEEGFAWTRRTMEARLRGTTRSIALYRIERVS